MELYHFTSASAALQILQTGRLRSDLNRDYMDKGNVSFTTDINFYKRAVSGFGAAKKAVALAVDSEALQANGFVVTPHVYSGTKEYDYSKEKEVRVKGDVPAKYVSKVILIEKNVGKEPYFVEKLTHYAKEKNIPLEIVKKHLKETIREQLSKIS